MINSKTALVVCAPWTVASPHIGVGYLASYLRQKACQVRTFDLNIEFYNGLNERYKRLWNFDNKHFWTVKSCFEKIIKDNQELVDELIKKVFEYNPGIVGLSVTTSSRLFAIEIAKTIKRINKNILIVVGGLGCFTPWERRFFPERYVDYFVIGEGEAALYELVDKVASGKPLEGIPGLMRNNPDGEASFIPRPFINDLDTVNFPTYEDLNLAKYVERVLPMIMSRGCINKCAFCHEHVYWGSVFRAKSAERVFEEIRYHVEVNKIRNFIFNDFLINGNVKLLESFCDMIISSKLSISWVCNALVRAQMNEELFTKMHRAGCSAIMFGIESGSNKIIKKMNKNFVIEEAERVLSVSKNSGIKNGVHIMVGFPGEEESDFFKTVSFLQRARPSIDFISNVNDVHAVCNSDLVVNKEKYNIVMPSSKSYEWFTQEGLFPNVRQKRVLDMCIEVERLGFPKPQNNLYENKDQLFDIWELKRFIGEDINRFLFLASRFWQYFKKNGFSRVLFNKIRDYLRFIYWLYNKTNYNFNKRCQE